MKPISPLVIQPLDVGVEMDKRFHLPVKVSSVCPNCGDLVERDMTEDNYLAYPRTNRPAKLLFYHEQSDGGEDCGAEWEYKVIVRVTLEAAQ